MGSPRQRRRSRRESSARRSQHGSGDPLPQSSSRRPPEHGDLPPGGERGDLCPLSSRIIRSPRFSAVAAISGSPIDFYTSRARRHQDLGMGDDRDDRPRSSGSSIFGTLLSIGFVALCLRNVFMDDTVALASKAACDNRPGCFAQMSKGLRTPIGHFYHFTVAGNDVEIECMRAYLLGGEYSCKNKAHGNMASLSASAASAPACTAAPISATSAPKPHK